MAMEMTRGARFRLALREERPLQIPGVLNAYAAMLARREGFRAIYLSGAGVANYSCGLPDLGITTMEDVLVDARRIVAAVETPLLVDIDTGWGGAFNIARTIRSMESAGVAAVHIEDQVTQKRCGHRPNKAIVSVAEMVDRVKAAVDARIDPDFVIIARTDALQTEGIDGVVERARAYVEAGADAIFAEAMPDIELYSMVTAAVGVPVLANMTEFGLTPLYGSKELGAKGVAMVLYPLSAARAMQAAAIGILHAIRTEGTQASLLDRMQQRSELYEVLGYREYEDRLDRLFARDSGSADSVDHNK